jgi:hypothetical protein
LSCSSSQKVDLVKRIHIATNKEKTQLGTHYMNLINKWYDNEQELNDFIGWTRYDANETWNELKIQCYNLCWKNWKVLPF